MHRAPPVVKVPVQKELENLASAVVPFVQQIEQHSWYKLRMEYEMYEREEPKSQSPPDATADEGITNDERASWAEVGLIAFGQRTSMVRSHIGDKEDAFFVVVDLLCDIAHWCDRNDVDLQSALRLAKSHYIEETSGQGTQLR